MYFRPGDCAGERVITGTMAEMRRALTFMAETTASDLRAFLDRQQFVTDTEKFNVVIDLQDYERILAGNLAAARAAHERATAALQVKLDAGTTLEDMDAESAAEYDTRQDLAIAIAQYDSPLNKNVRLLKA